jgi:hypothetical protein
MSQRRRQSRARDGRRGINLDDRPREPEPSIINEKTVADFTRVVEQMRQP